LLLDGFKNGFPGSTFFKRGFEFLGGSSGGASFVFSSVSSFLSYTICFTSGFCSADKLVGTSSGAGVCLIPKREMLPDPLTGVGVVVPKREMPVVLAGSVNALSSAATILGSTEVSLAMKLGVAGLSEEPNSDVA